MAGDHLNFLSPQFNALLALTTPDVHPPIPNARPLDNIRACRRLLPPDHPLHLPSGGGTTNQHQPQTNNQDAKERAKQRISYLQQKRERENNRINPIDEIANRFTDGPFSLLRRCYQSRSVVRVVTRHDRGVRGVAIGTLIAFDKHMNLVLKDVEERYTVLVTVQRNGRHCRKQEQRQRRLKQVFVAGNSVVLVGLMS